MKNKKKGFTLVELLVVIAILAILATVSIVSYVTFTSKAKVSNDISLTKQMNTVLQANEALDKADTMTEVRAQLLENGLDLEKLSPTSEGYNFVWDSKSNRMFLLDETGTKVSPNGLTDENTADTFVILHKNADVQTWVGKNYSLYLASDFDATTLNVTSVTGIDAGNSKVKEITLSGQEAETVLVNGNLDKLTINTPNATINQYGTATVADVQAVDPNNSLHVFGKIIQLDVTSGHVVVEAKAEVSTVNDTQQNSNVTVDIKVSATVGAVVSAKVDILVQGSSKPVEPEVVKPEAVNKDFAGGIGTKASPYLISTPSQYNNINKLYTTTNKKEYHFKQINDLKVTNTIKYIFGSYDGQNHRIEAANGIKLPHFFDEICGHTTFTNMNMYLTGHYTPLLRLADWGTDYGVTMKNITFDSDGRDIVTNNNNVGLFILNALYTKSTTNKKVSYVFENCVNNVNFQNLGTCTGVFIGSGPCFDSDYELIFKNCVNNGTIVGNQSVGYLYGNAAYIETLTNGIIIENCINNGILLSYKQDAVVEFAPSLKEVNDKYQAVAGGKYIRDNYLLNKELSINLDGNIFSVNSTDKEVSYRLAIIVHTVTWPTNEMSNSVRFFVDLPTNTSGTTLTNKLYAIDYNTAVAKGILTGNEKLSYQNMNSMFEGTIYTKDNTTYLILNTPTDFKVDSNVSLEVFAIKNGCPIGVKSIIK